MTKDAVDAAIAALETWGRTVDNWVLICAAGVAIFLAAEVVFSVAHWINERNLRPLRALQSDFHTKELLALGKSADEAKERAAQAELELAKFKAPRLLTEADQAELAKKLQAFAGVPFDGAAQNDPEPITLLLQIAEAAKVAGWNWQPWTENPIVLQKPGMPSLGMINGVGVEIQIAESKREVWEKAVIALRDALNAIGIATNGLAVAEGGGVSDKAIHINVGKKP